MKERRCIGCKRKLHEGEGLEDGICGDCGLATMFGAIRDCICVEKESGDLLTKEMLEQAIDGK